MFSRVFCVTNQGNLDCLDNLRQNACIWRFVCIVAVNGVNSNNYFTIRYRF